MNSLAMPRRQAVLSVLAALLLLTPGREAAAHKLLLNCKSLDASQVRCQAEFSDGSDAAGMKLEVKAYDERVLLTTSLGTDSSATFKRPTVEFFVRLFDGGEHAAEVDHTDID